MVTIIYNTITSEVLHRIQGEYLVDGQPGLVESPLVKLTEQLTEKPSFYPKTEWCKESWNVQGSKYVQVWSVTDKTEQEMIDEAIFEADEKDTQINYEQVKKLLRMSVDDLPENELYQYPSLYPAWKPGLVLIDADDSPTGLPDKVQYNDKLYKVVQSHTTQLDWQPDIVPAMFTIYNPPDVIPEWVQPTGAQDAYNTGDKVTHNGKNWQSTVDNNVWEPGVYGWTEIA